METVGSGIRGDPEDGLGEGVEELFPRAWVSLSPACATIRVAGGQLGKGLSLIYPDFYLISCSPRRSGSCELIARSHYAACIANGL